MSPLRCTRNFRHKIFDILIFDMKLILFLPTGGVISTTVNLQMQSGNPNFKPEQPQKISSQTTNCVRPYIQIKV